MAEMATMVQLSTKPFSHAEKKHPNTKATPLPDFLSIYISLCASRQNRNLYTFQPFFGHSIPALEDNELKYSGTSQCMGSKIIQTQPLRFPAVMILKEIAGINPFLGITYCLDNGRTCLLSELMTIHTPSLHPCSLRSLLSINCTNVKEDHLQDI